MSKRFHSQKKRHTKPCRYFQVNKCPHPADVCDFAHVMASPVTPISAEKGSMVCRYYSVGRCASGALCRYQHGIEARIDDWAAVSADPTYLDSPSLYGSSPAYGPSWPPSIYSPSTSFPSAGDLILFASPTDSGASVDTASNSISSVESDDVIVVTDDPQYGEHPHSYQSQVCISDDSSVIHVPPFCSTANGMYSPTSVYDYAYTSMMGGMKLPDAMKRHNSSKSISKQKALKYKTKPCKFFSKDGGCPNGSQCTFIHDEQHSGASSPRPSKQFKSASANEESDRKNFFPIPWRVIGGGVLVGVKKGDEADDHLDNSYSDHPLPSSKPSIGLSPLKIISRQRSNSIPPTPSTAQVKVERLFSAESPGVL